MKDYKRLTEKTKLGTYIIGDDRPIIQRLGELEDKIEQGRLIELPCKVGDTIYEVIKGFPIKEWEVNAFRINGTSLDECVINVYKQEIGMLWKFWCSDFGEKLFSTKAKAEAKLKELRGGE